ncbi:MAG: sugar transferase [Candidatus Adlerbacteria bacterium GW2011_GWA2_54_12]|uniref:Sugar transferase n=2 Tax=Candidatus Adleribacteriota TaxID=1752736 RepID=A0A0G1XXR4_9BACT|nr:MAG: sugar transferase [Candidatus Adlerbacteria bacterium GW2011_GWA1_54_10]KKW36336.1 MAG: sugar transferase [Candidatus Adlerbacteria bacterium GW2011_GWA2_54_12]KKW37868.1 MAG: sugar transferase [Candidatus Adlerbacteria bacterium GW2011_GWB1_54_7]
MTTVFRPRTLILFAGDLIFFVLALWFSLALRELMPPPSVLFFAHLVPFAFLFAAWISVFFIAGLYERSVILARRALSATLLVAQIINLVLAALFFFFVPAFGIAPKTLLVIYLIVSFLLVLLWRAALFPRLGQGEPERALLIGESPRFVDLSRALNTAHRSPTRVVAVLKPQEAVPERVRSAIAENGISVVIADFNHPSVARAFPGLFNLLTAGVSFFDAAGLYEEVFGRILLSQIDDRWIARNVSRYAHTLYDPVKRLMDIVIALPAALFSLVFYPFIALTIKIEDGGEVLISMPRAGEGGAIFNLYKFRSMTGNDRGMYGPGASSKLQVTRVGRFLRISRLDELPQLWNVVRGDISLIGPRPEFPPLVEEYARQIPYYNFRHLVKPGLSGWAQLYHDRHPHHEAQVEATREKFSFDLYYLKHRSLLLDATIVLKTVKKLIMHAGA